MHALPLKLYVAQLNPIVGDLAHNRDKILKAWREAPQDVDLIVYSELILSGYPPEDLVLKPFFMNRVKACVDELVEASKDLPSAALISTPWIIEDKIYNAALLIEHGEIKAVRAKHHLPNYGVFDELRIFTRGDMPEPIEFRGVKLGILTCEDMWHPDVCTHLKARGAEILISMHGSPFDADKNDLRQHYAHRRVMETSLPLLYVNQVGGQDELVFDGASFMLDQDGEIFYQAPEFEEVCEVVSDKVTPAYDDGEAIYRALVLGLKDYIVKNKFPGILLGLSGGIDSALSAVIAVDAVGKDNVHCVMLPSRYTSQDSLDDAQALADNLDVRLDSLNIESTVKALNAELAPFFDENTPAVTFENIQPRTRGLMLMALSNASGKMVLSTGNKSEMAVGYATLYGDMCGGFNALKDLYKTQVYELSNWCNRNGEIIPERIITKAPTAELRENQTDQDSLPEYEELDDILMCLIERDMGISDIVERGHTRETVARVWRLLDRAEYKRRQAAPGIKITSRAFGRDRRYPITNHFLNIIESDRPS